MKAIVFQLLASGLALGVMGGSVGIHWLHLSGAKELPNQDAVTAFPQPEKVMTSNVSSDRVVGPVKTTSDPTIVAFEEIISRLQELKSENSNLREQLQETNRDLNELQFRVDTHSDGFRPMRVSAGAAGLREGFINPGESIHPLLPPK